ncbi:MAG: amino acid permease [Acidimicrobiia bacterium]|nr:amino acid permease [Acidimicrobiia bacterium]
MAVDEATQLEADTQQLHGMGYAQELNRGFSGFSNFAISFSIISVLAGALTVFYLPLISGGPAAITTSWIVIGFFALIVGMAMAEICSAMPTAGGLYYWSAKLAKTPEGGAKAAWYTGWFNLLGQVGVIASVDYALSVFIAFFVQLYASSWFGMSILDYKSVFIIYTFVLISHGLLNTFGVRLVKLLADVSVWWHVIGTLIIVIIMFSIPTQDNIIGLSHIFDFENVTGFDFGGSGFYVFLVGLLVAQYTITGFDASAHVSEETKGANVSAPKALVRSIYISAIGAWILTLSITQAIPKGVYANVVAGLTSDTDGAISLIPAPLRVIETSVGGNLSKLIIFIAIVGQFFCGMCGVTANSRMVYAFSRDGALPGSKLFHRINTKTRTPTNAVWLGVTLSWIVGLLTVLQADNYAVAFFALVGITAVGLYIAYVIPVFLRLRKPDFVQGPWNLRGASKLVGWTAVIYVVIVNLIFFLPQFGPWSDGFWPPWGGDVPGTTFNRINNFNFTGPLIILGAVAIWAYWHLSAKKWFKGPQVMGTEEELRDLEAHLAAVERGEATPESIREMEDKMDARHGKSKARS